MRGAGYGEGKGTGLFGYESIGMYFILRWGFLLIFELWS
jgi:hypothetical protein